MIERYIELDGPDKGRIKNVGIAFDLADIEEAWREEGDGTPMLDPPERAGKHEVHFRELVNDQLKKLIIDDASAEFSLQFDAIYNTPEARAKDPENTDPLWIEFRNASKLAAETSFQSSST